MTPTDLQREINHICTKLMNMVNKEGTSIDNFEYYEKALYDFKNELDKLLQKEVESYYERSDEE